MNAQSDPQLLRAYADCRSEAAFAELVSRHIDFVHSAAIRTVNDPHLAKDVSQGVFAALAKDAGKLTDHPVLSGWLHRTARNIAAQTIRTDVRRRKREQLAAVMNEDSETDASWKEIAPHLDAALADLSDADRDAVLLRYFENKPAQEMAAILGISAEAAQKRVSRAVERLREIFAERGITAGAAGLTGTISANAVQAAPVGLATAISGSVCAGTTTAAIVTKLIALSVIQKTIVAAAMAALLAVITSYQIQKRTSAPVTALASATLASWPTKSHARVRAADTAEVSAHNKARIRSTLQSATRTADPFQKDDAAVRELEDLLRSRPGDLAFVHELALEAARSTPQETQVALAAAVVRRHADGDFQKLGELIDALGTEGAEVGILVGWFAEELAEHKDQDLAVRAFEELLARPSKAIHRFHYDYIAWGATRTLGHPEALARIPDIHDGWFGTAAANRLIASWVSTDPVAASTYLRDLPPSASRDSLIIHLVEELASSEDFSMANDWAKSLQGGAKEKALAMVKREQDILRRRDEQRAQRGALKDYTTGK